MNEEFEKQKQKLIETYNIMIYTCQLNREADTEYWDYMLARVTALKTLALLTL